MRCHKAFKKIISLSLVVTYIVCSGCVNKAELKIEENLSSNNSNTASLTVASEISFEIEPGGGNASAAWLQQPKVIILNSSGQKVLTGVDAFALITLSITDGTGSFVGTTSAYAVLGEASFINLGIDLVGNKKITATKADTSALGGSTLMTVESNLFTINSAAASKIQLSSSLTTIAPATCQLIQVKLTDVGGNLVNTISSLPLSLSGLMNANLYTDSDCTLSLTTPAIAAGGSSLDFYLKDLGQETIHLTASALTSGITQGKLDLKITQLHISKLFMSSNNAVFCKLFTNGTAFCQNSSTDWGQQGYLNSSSPKIISFSSPIVELALAQRATCALLLNGNVHCWGYKSGGILGDGSVHDNTVTLIPSNVILPGPATQIVALDYSMCALVTVATVPRVYCWGLNSGKVLGDGTTTDRSTPIQSALALTGGQSVVKIRSSSILMHAVLNDGTVKRWGQNVNPTTIASLTNVADIFSYGNIYNCAIDLSANVLCWGINEYGRLGLGIASYVTVATPTLLSGLSSVVKINLNVNSVVATKADGSLFYWGLNFNTPEQDVPAILVNVPVRDIVSALYSYCGISTIDDTQVICWGQNTFPELKYDKPAYQNISLSSGATMMSSGDCTNLSALIKNQNNSRALREDLTLTPIDQTGGGAFYLDSDCTYSILDFVIPAGEIMTSELYYKSTYMGANASTAHIKVVPDNAGTSAGLTSIQLTGQVSRVDTNFYFDTSGCYSMTLIARDNKMNEVKTNSDIISTLVLSIPSNVKIYSDPACTIEASSFTIQANTSRKTFYTHGQEECSSSNLTVNTPGIAISSYETSYMIDCSN